MKNHAYFARIGIIAAGYLLLGAAVRLIEPGAHIHPEALWPAAGLALAALLAGGRRCWPGVWLGGLLLAVGNDLSATGIAVAAATATGATLQALLGATLTRHLYDRPAPLTRDGDVAKFLLLGGPLPCLVGASIEIFALTQAGQLSMAELPAAWLLTWAANALGVLLFTPPLLALIERRQDGLRDVAWVAVPLLLTGVLLYAGHYGLQRWSAELASESAERRMTLAFAVTQDALRPQIQSLHGVERMIAVDPLASSEDFFTFTRLARGRDGTLLVGWHPRVSDAERPAFEAAMSDRLGRRFQILERTGDGSLVPAERRADYFPLMLVAPTSDPSLLGVDIGALGTVRTALEHVRKSHRSAITEAVPVGDQRVLAKLVLTPHYGAEMPSEPELKGLVVGVYDLRAVYAPLAQAAERAELLVRATDVTPGIAPATRLETLPAGVAGAWQQGFSFGGRTWSVEFSPVVAAGDVEKLARAGLYALVSLLAGFLMAQTVLAAAGRQASTAFEVGARTSKLRDELAARHAAEQALQASERRYRHLIEQAPHAMFVHQHGRIVFANPKAVELFGAGADSELLGREVMDLLDPAMRSRISERVRRILEENDNAPPISQEWQRLDGSRFIGESSAVRYLYEGEPAVLVQLTDISAHKQVEAALAHAKAEAESASRAKSAFLATMSHEIRTPMNGVLGLLEVLAHSELTEDQRDLVATVRGSSITLLTLIDDILDFSKIEAGRMELEHEPVAIADLAEALCTSLIPMAEARGVRIRVAVDPALPPLLMGDDLRLRQVIYNLLGNAIKFSGDNPQRPGQVVMRVYAEGARTQRLVIEIADNGIGMSAQALEKLFTPFSQAEADTTRRFGGTGLGLTICRRLVALMGGEIRVQSRLGEGSIFTVSLPIELPATPTPPNPTDLSGLTCILLPTDPPGDAEDGRRLLERLGARVRLATDAAEAAQLLSGDPASTVIVHDARSGSESLPARLEPFAALTGVRHLLVTGERYGGAQMLGDNAVVLAYGLLNSARAFVRAVAVAAGRASPDVVRPTQPMPAATPPSFAEARRQGRLILVAEDDLVNQKVILRQLAHLGFTAEVAGDGAEALALWRRGDYALVITDLHMPTMDGYQLAEAIRHEQAGGERVPIIALTANALRGEAQRARAAGIDEYLTKPAPLQTLAAVLHRWLAAAPPAAEPSAAERDVAPLNVAMLRQLVGDDPTTLSELLSDYLRAAREQAGELHAAAEAGDSGRIAAITHKLKSSSRAVGALSLADLCARLENAAKARDRRTLEQALLAFDPLLAEVEAAVATQIDRFERGS